MVQSSRVLIAGAGIGGLALAQGLRKYGIEVTVFEKDASSDFRAQGYRFRMNEQGSVALKKLLPDALFTQFEQTAATICLGGARAKSDGTILQENVVAIPGRIPGVNADDKGVTPPGPGGSGPGQHGVYTVDRTLFRAILLQNLDVQFGKEATGYTVDEGKVTLHFADGSSATGDFLVGAEGVRSAVRKQLVPHHIPVDTQGRIIYGKTPITTEFLERFPKEMHSGMSMTRDVAGATIVSALNETIRFTDEAKALSASILPQPSQDYIYWVLVGTPATFELPDSKFLKLTPQQVVEHSLKITKGWAPSIRALFEFQSVDQAAALRISSVVPEIPVWQSSDKVTLLGDAVHVMSPTGGIGANTTLRDSAALCEVIRKGILGGGEVSVDDIRKYEADMRLYAGEAVSLSQQGGARIYGQPPFEECKPVDWL